MGNRKAGRSKFTEYMIWAVLLLVIAVMTARSEERRVGKSV